MAMPDTGANKSIISSSVLDTLLIRYGTSRTSRKYEIISANGTPMNCLGAVNLNIFYEGKTTPIHALVSDQLKEILLISYSDLQRMRILPETFPHIIDNKQDPTLLANTTSREENFNSLLEEFKDVFNEEKITPMTGKPMHIHIRKDSADYRPLKMKIARRTPKHFQEQAKQLIQKLLDSGVIVKVPTNENVEWCSPGFFVPKPGGKVRLVTDYRQINQFIDRPVHPFPSSRDILRNIRSDSQWFLKFDAVQGYFQVPLDEESSYLTTFLVETGRYRFTRAPMGLNPSSDYFCERSDMAFANIPDLLKIVDDGLLQAPTKQDLLKLFRQILECCRKSNLTLSRPKLQMGQSVVFAGYEVTKDGVKPEQRKIESISKFPVPTNITELRSFLGLVNQLGIFIPDLAHVTQDLRGLLKKNVAYTWLEEHQRAFEETKSLLCSDLLIQPFDVNLKTELLTDASRLFGLGYALIQRDPEHTKLHLVQCGSRSLNSAESRYSTTELECLAIYYAIKDCEFYLQGIGFDVLTDHKPLVGTFRKPLHELENARLLRFREKLAHFDFKVDYVAGKTHLIADALSRAPVFSPPENEVIINSLAAEKLSADPLLQKFYDAALSDKAYLSIVKALLDGKQISNLPPGHPAHAYRSLWDNISVLDDILLVLNDSRIIVPNSIRPEILSNLHASHSGITKTKQLAKQLYYWPGMNAAIQTLIENCEDCQHLRPSQSDKPQAHPTADAPMHSISLDLFEHAGKHYLVMVDRYSYFIWVHVLNSLNTAAIIRILEGYFLELGYPFIIVSDNGPQFRSEFKDYCKSHSIIHSTSSPYNPRSNGLAESAVKNAKLLLQKSDSFKDFQAKLQHWRNVPSSHKLASPAELFYGRKQRNSFLPSLPIPSLPTPCPSPSSQLPQLNIGDRVRVQHPSHGTWDTKGVITAIRDSTLSYDVSLDTGESIHRGRRLLKLDRSRAPSPDPPALPSRALDPSPMLPSTPDDGQRSSGEVVDTSQDNFRKNTPAPLRRGTRNRIKKRIFDPSA